MKVGIICAGSREFTPFLEDIQVSATSEKASRIFYEGELENVPIAAVCSGGCRVNAAVAAQIMIDIYSVDIIINAGTAGGIRPDINLFDTVISTEAAYHDVAQDTFIKHHPCMSSQYFQADKTLLELSRKAVSQMDLSSKVLWGRMVTGETFISENGRERIIDEFSPLCVDMETAGVAHVCLVNHIPFIAIRSITDTASYCGLESFRCNCEKAAGVAENITKALLREIKVHL